MYIYSADFRGGERTKQKMKVLILRKFDLLRGEDKKGLDTHAKICIDRHLLN
jgi:hypothetical protein